jgi:hypothetical protein
MNATTTKESTMTTHTPGPWEAQYQPFSPAHTIGKRAANGSLDLIADLKDSVAQLDERHANATLIAAAPELLKALKLAHTWMTHEGKESRVVADAINKAEGN